MDKLNMFQSRLGKIDEFGMWDLERILSNDWKQFTLTKVKEECRTCEVQLTLAAWEH